MTGPRADTGAGDCRCGTTAREVAAGHRFAGLFGTARPEGLLLSAHVATAGDIAALRDAVPPGATTATRR